MFKLDDFANGALTEKFNTEAQRVLENIADPNTDPKKARTITMTITLKADENRELAMVDINTKASLAPSKGVQTKIIMGRDRQGKVEAAELKSGAVGQTYITDEGDFADDKGNKVVQFK
ncbi:replication terminator protein [Brevibacillus fortis]|uniref:Replication terminator protein n=1 Tax=Brevibacillus fortis TaxID=2126352 RepID=A0A2P7V3W0_9BACL|nr:replication terminator protein [Brevibacillus fortis]PSJ93880.1 replication terminator protein [Brevibacillus fortis]